jgi:tetratricopeptide (TPR) repeat protein
MPKAQRGSSRPSPDHARVTSPANGSSPTALALPARVLDRRPTYPEAVARYEAGIRSFQEHRFAAAAEAFRDVLRQYPEEKELNERVRVYLTACERQIAGAHAQPQNQEQRLFAATLAMNAGDIDTALQHLEAVVAEDGNHDGALYMLGVGHALRNDDGKALAYLQRAIACNPANRHAALRDGDLERLLRNESIRSALNRGGDSRGGDAARTGRPHSGR